MEKSGQQIIYCDALDFENVKETREPVTALLSIAKHLIEEGKIALPAFCFGFLKYLNSSSLTTNFQEQYSYLYKITGRNFVGNPKLNSLLNEISHFGLNTLLGEAVGNIPFIGNLMKNKSNEGKNKLIEWIQGTDVKEILEDIDSLDKFSLLSRLPALLGYDVYKALEHDSLSGNKERRIVIIIDGYETLWSGEKNNDINRDSWVRTLVRYMPGVLFTIFGRDKLRWSEVEKDEEFINAIDQHIIKGFSDEDADGFLKSVPIDELEIRNAIICNAKANKEEDGCLPLYLQLESKTYENIINSGRKPSKDDFAQGNVKTDKEIIDRFFKHLDPQIRSAIRALSLSNYIDEEIIEVIEKADGLAANTIDLKTLNEYSFITMQGSKVMMHSLVREVASDEMKIANFKKYCNIHATLFSFFNSKISPDEYQEITPDTETLIEYAGFHLERYSINEFPEWILNKANSYYGNSYYNVLNKFLQKAVEIFFSDKKQNISFSELSDDEKELLGKLYYYIAKNYEESGNGIEANRYISSAITSFENILTEEKLEELKHNYIDSEISEEDLIIINIFNTILQLSASIKSGLGKNIESGENYDRARNLADDFNLEFNDYEYARHLRNIGRLAEAEPVFFETYMNKRAIEKQILAISNENELRDFFKSEIDREEYSLDELKRKSEDEKSIAIDQAACAAVDLAKLLKLQGRFEEAIYYNEKAIEQLKKIYNDSDIKIAIYNHFLAITLLQEEKDLERAELLLNQTWEKYKVYYNEKHVNVGQFYKDMFDLFLTKDVEKAMDYYYKAVDIISKNIGEGNTRFMEMHLDFYKSLKKIEEIAYDEENAEDNAKVVFALGEMFESVLVKIFFENFTSTKNLFGIYDPYFHLGIELTAEILDKQNNKKDSDNLRKKKDEFKRILNKRTDVRVNNLNVKTIVDLAEKEKLITRFRKITSLPRNIENLELEIIELPFYKTFNLCRIKFLNLKNEIYKYILLSETDQISMNWKNEPFYLLGEKDLNLNEESVKYYCTFFLDSVSGRHGKFYIIENYEDIPWMIDIEIDSRFKEGFKKIILPMEVISSDEKQFVLKCNILFQKSIFESKLTVNKQDGRIDLPESEAIFIDVSGEEFLPVMESDFDLIDDEQKRESIVDTIPACVDPLYWKEAEPEVLADPFEQQFVKGLEFVKYDSETLFLLFKESHENKIEKIKAFYKESKELYEIKKHIDLIKALSLFNTYYDFMQPIYSDLENDLGKEHVSVVKNNNKIGFIKELIELLNERIEEVKLNDQNN